MRASDEVDAGRTKETSLNESRFAGLDLRPLLGWLYPDDPVTRLLLARPISVSREHIRMLLALLRSLLLDEGLRFRLEPRKPGGLSIEITNACNLRCTMCNLVTMERPPRLMKMDVYRLVIDRCVEAGIRAVRLHTYGETLVHPRLPEMLKYAKQNGIKVWISTNAQLLDERRARAILEAGVSCVRYSIEGATRETYERVRVRANWDTLMTNIARFKVLRDEISPCTRLALNTVLMVDTLPDVGKVQEVFGPFVDEIEISALESLGTRGHELSQGQWLEQVDLNGRIPCRLLWDMMNVSVDGKATLCCADVEAENVVGDVLEQDLLAIWRGPELRAARDIHRERRFDKMSICSKCSYGVTNTARNRLRYALLSGRASYGRGPVR